MRRELKALPLPGAGGDIHFAAEVLLDQPRKIARVIDVRVCKNNRPNRGRCDRKRRPVAQPELF